MTTVQKPREKPNSANFGSGPTAKPNGWSLNALADGALGRSHRSSLGLKKLREAINHTKCVQPPRVEQSVASRHARVCVGVPCGCRSFLNVPKDYHVGIVPASDTGAFEMAMWSMLGACRHPVPNGRSFIL